MRLFMKQNSSLFRQDPFPWEVFKKFKHKFFTEQVKSPVPRDSEIASDILEGMIVSHQINSKEALDKILELPFFKRAIQNKQYYYERLALKAKQVAPLLDVTTIEKAEEMERLRTQLKDEVREEMVEKKEIELKQWDDKISEKAEMYFAFPSILDKEEYPLPDVVEENLISEGMFLPWWEKLGLVEDPFKELDGLTDIKNSYYNKIVHKTQIFLRYEACVQNSISELFRNTVIYGQFGSGKTTLFDYLIPIFSQNKIYPIYIQLSRGLEVHALIFEFQKKVGIELKKLFSILIGEKLPLTEASSDQESIIDLMKKITYGGAKGFVIIVDDLHKGDLEDAMNFMSYLQVLASQFRRGTDLKIGFIVAGALEWESRIDSEDKFSGSVNRQEHMPSIDVDTALDAINKRLEAFARNPENPRTIESSFVERIYNRLKYSDQVQKITFRKIMGELLKEFNDGHFTALSANPIKISAESKNCINLLLEKHPMAKRQIEDFISKSKDIAPSHRRRCLELLVRIYLNNGLIESEIREPEVPFLQRLAKSRLIVKVVAKDILIWKISKELYLANKAIIREFKLSIEDYLFQLYADQLPEKRKEAKLRNEEITQLDMILKLMPKDLGGEFLSDARQIHMKVLETEDNLSSDESAITLVKRCTTALAMLTKSYMFYARESIPSVRDEIYTLSFWNDFWWCPESILQYCRAVASDIDVQKKIPLILSLYRESFLLISNFYKNEYENSSLFYIPLSLLKNDEIKLLHECRRFLSDNRYEEAIDGLAKYVDRKLRTFLHNIFTIFYGDYESRLKWLDRATQMQIRVNIGNNLPSRFSALRNEFSTLGTVMYRYIMTGIDSSSAGRRNWRCIFGHVFDKWQERDLYNYLGVLEGINERLPAMGDNETFGSKQDYVFEFVKKSIQFMRSINRTYLRLITSDYVRYEKTASFSMCSFNDIETLKPIEVNKEDIERIVELLKDKNKLRILLDDQEYVEGFFGMEYRKAYAILAILHLGVECSPDKNKVTLEMISSKSPVVQVRLSKAISWATTTSSKEDKSV